MTTLNDPILQSRNNPNEEIIKSWIIQGGSDLIQEKLKLLGWNEDTPIASIALHQDDSGKIVDTQIFLFGYREIGRISANIIWGD